MKAEISKIEIKIGPKTIELSLSEVKELKRILAELIPDDSVPVVIEKWVDRPFIPYYKEWQTSPYLPPWTVTCENNTLSLVLK